MAEGIAVEFGNDISGTTTTRPSDPITGARYYNTTTGQLEIYNGSTWAAAGTEVGDVGAVTGTNATVVESGSAAMHKTVITFAATPVTMADNAGVTGHGGLLIYTLPQGFIKWQGATANVTATATSLGIDVDAGGDFGLGTVTSDNTATPLASTEQDIINNLAITFASVGGVGVEVINANQADVATLHDGHTTPAPVFFNFKIDDADQDMTATPCNLLLTGTVTLLWSNLGDY